MTLNVDQCHCDSTVQSLGYARAICTRDSGRIGMQANDLVSRRCASSCRSSELHEDLVVAADLQMFTVRHPEAFLQTVPCPSSCIMHECVAAP